MKKVFEIEYPDVLEEGFITSERLKSALISECFNTLLNIREVINDKLIGLEIKGTPGVIGTDYLGHCLEDKILENL